MAHLPLDLHYRRQSHISCRVDVDDISRLQNYIIGAIQHLPDRKAHHLILEIAVQAPDRSLVHVRLLSRALSLLQQARHSQPLGDFIDAGPMHRADQLHSVACAIHHCVHLH